MINERSRIHPDDVPDPCVPRAQLDRRGLIKRLQRAERLCIATNPSDMSVALAALDALVHIAGPSGERTIALTDFHRLPGDTPHIDTNLGAGEIITAIELAPRGFARN